MASKSIKKDVDVNKKCSSCEFDSDSFVLIGRDCKIYNEEDAETSNYPFPDSKNYNYPAEETKASRPDVIYIPSVVLSSMETNSISSSMFVKDKNDEEKNICQSWTSLFQEILCCY